MSPLATACPEAVSDAMVATAALQEESPRQLLLRANVLLVVLLASYGVVGPASSSLFLHAYSSALLPWACWSTAGCSIAVAWAVRRLCLRHALQRVFLTALLTSIVFLLAVLAAQALAIRWAAFALYVFKEVYIVVLVELFWLNANVVCTPEMARRYYGWLCAAASAGCLAGGSFNGMLARRLGTIGVLWVGLGLMLCALPCAKAFASMSTRSAWQPMVAPHIPEARHASRSVSHHAVRLAFLVLCFHVLMTLTDFIYIDAMARLYTHLDERTVVMSQVQTATNAFAFVAQIGHAWVMRILGLRGMLSCLPFFLGATFGVFCALPNALTVAMIKITSKIADYALFRSAKETLYLPLSRQVKTTSKTWDMSAYLCAKALASWLILACTGAGLKSFAGWLHAAFCLLLLLSAVLCLQNHAPARRLRLSRGRFRPGCLSAPERARPGQRMPCVQR